MPTQKQIAEKLGISQITVSRVINHHPSVSPRTRARVMRALERGYVLNANARNLVLGRSGRLALVIPGADTFNAPFLPQVLAGITAAMLPRHYASFFLDVAGAAALEETALGLRGADAAIVFNFSMMQPYLNSLLRVLKGSRKPYILVQSHGFGTGPVLSVDNAQGGELAVRHLLELGHRRIVFVGQKQSLESRERRQGYQRALRRAGVVMNPKWIFELTNAWGVDDCVRAMQKLGRERPTAVFVYSDSIAVALLYEFARAGVRVPEDISVVGFNDFKPFPTMVKPHLTTVRQPLRELGALAVQMVLGEHPPCTRRLLPTALVVRDSTAAFGGKTPAADSPPILPAAARNSAGGGGPTCR